ncbi:MAG: nucleotidyltransferase [Acidimicrobiaceae bacterium]|nr:nucleotidyltransferase [Acidimicrobiaceae bacterium]MYG56897.1 nucleotidyltransferase [Acidimicrobiaceae bacterium]MYJ98400.1 nucleotidyltransferase [Acidimicrobiaceae bacterium]
MNRRDKLLRDHRQAIRDAAQRSGVKVIALTGSMARGEDTPHSDHDFLVIVHPRQSTLSNLSRLERDLESLLETPVDVVTVAGLHPSCRSMLDDALVV